MQSRSTDNFVHCIILSFALPLEFLQSVKTLLRDLSALNSLQVSCTTEAYKLKYGLAKSIKEEQYDILQKTFSLAKCR